MMSSIRIYWSEYKSYLSQNHLLFIDIHDVLILQGFLISTIFRCFNRNSLYFNDIRSSYYLHLL